MLALIVVALAILACSQRNRRSTATAQDTETGKGIKLNESNNSPKFVVLMAGDNIPTYVAAPVAVN